MRFYTLCSFVRCERGYRRAVAHTSFFALATVLATFSALQREEKQARRNPRLLYCTDMADTVIISTISATCIRDQTLRYGRCSVPSIMTSHCSRPFSLLLHFTSERILRKQGKAERERERGESKTFFLPRESASDRTK